MGVCVYLLPWIGLNFAVATMTGIPRTSPYGYLTHGRLRVRPVSKVSRDSENSTVLAGTCRSGPGEPLPLHPSQLGFQAYFSQQWRVAPAGLKGILTLIFLGLDLGYLLCGIGILSLTRRGRRLASARQWSF